MGDRGDYKVFYNEKHLDLKGINIYPDDNIGLLLKKISYVTKDPWTHLFAWYHRKVSNVQKDALIQTFIKNIFRSEKRISIKKLCQTTKSFFAINIDALENEYNIVDIPQALEILREYTKSVRSIIEPLGFKYTYNGYIEYISYDPFFKETLQDPPSIYNNELALTLQSFDIINNEIHIINTTQITDKPYLFPFIDQKHDMQTTNTLIKDLIKIEDSIETVDISDLNNTGFINFIHIHADSDKMKVDLVKVFEYLHASNTVTFIKLKLKTNAFYKIHETYIEPLANDKELYKKLVGVGGSTNNQNEYIMFRMRLGPYSAATILFFENGSYDIRLNFNMKAQETKANVAKYLELINLKIIGEITKATRKIITKLPHDILDNKYDDCYIVKTVFYGQVTSKNFQFKFSNFPTIIRSKLFPYFDVIPNPDKNILHLQYKKVDNYAQYDNIRSFITQHFAMDKDELVNKLAENFTLTIEEAEKQLDLWKISNEVELVQMGPENRYYKPKYDSFVNIKIRINSTIDLRYLVTGAKNAQVYDRISWLLKKLAKMSINSYKQKDEEFLKNFNKYIGLGQDDNNDKVTFADVEKDEDAVSIPDYSNELSDEIDEDLLALENEFAEDTNHGNSGNPSKSPQEKPKESDTMTSPTGGLKRKGELLRKLHEADERLFTYKVNKGEKRRDYASLCGSVGMRQPVVINKDELEKIEKNHKGAIEGYVKSGSNPDLAKKNYYICPSIWCPKSRVAITYDEYVKAGNKCPFPEINEEPVLFQSQSFWGVGELALKRKRYPSFLDMYTHPDQLCLPCCYKTAPSSGNRNKKRQEICKSNYEPNSTVNKQKDDIVPTIDDVIGNERYIKAETFSPLDVGRYGVAPTDVHKVLGLNHCGPRHDGTGVIQNGSTCYLRKGIAHGKQSFMSCINYILGIQNIKDRILTNLTVDKFLSMENGRLLKLFIDDSLDMENKETFTEFITWIQSQKNYIAKFNLSRLIERRETTPKELLREFLIWGAFNKFKAYLAEDDIEKDHLVLLDLVNIGIDWLNPKKIYCIVIEVDAVNGKAYVLCPSRPIGDDLDNVSIIIKRNGYYEPLIKVEHIPKQPLREEHIFNIRSDAAIRHLIAFFIKNCRIKDEKKKNIRAYIESKGYDVRSLVIDYDYKICGFLLKNNLYIPLFDRDAVFTESIGSGIADRYIYFNEIPRFRCTLKANEVKRIFELIRKYSEDDRYIINSWIKGSGQVYNGLLINDSETFIPLYLDNKSVTFEAFDDDLNIFVGDDDMINKLSKLLQTILDKDENSEVKQEIMFLMDTGNMIPYEYRIEKLHALMKKISINIPENIIKDVTARVARKLLPSHSMMTISASRFNAMADEFVLSYRDIKTGKLYEIWELQKNPFKHISETLFNMEVYSYELADEPMINNNMNEIMINIDYEDVPVKYQKKILKGFVVAKQREYNRDSLANLFINLTKNKIDSIVLEGNVKKTIMEDFKNANGRERLIEIFQSNPCYNTIWKKSKSFGMLDSYIESLDHMNYLPSFYEAIVYAKVCGVNLITLGHTTMKNPDGFKVFMTSMDTDKYLLLKHTYDRFNVHDRFDIITMKNRKDPIFKMADFSTEFAEMIHKKKLGEFEIEVEA